MISTPPFGLGEDERSRRAVVWRAAHTSTMERCVLATNDSGASLTGTIVGIWPSRGPTLIHYVVEVDDLWRTRVVHVRFAFEDGVQRLKLTADGHGHWLRDGEPVESLTGLIDIDLTPTPATNTLPMRRLGLAPGESAEVTAVWITIGTVIDVTPLRQRYTRRDATRWLYESFSDGDGRRFSSELTVDELVLVVTYGDSWSRVEA